jgi:hypothetical protein
VTINYGSDVTGFDGVRVGRRMPRAPVPFFGCGGTPHGRGSLAERTVSGGRLSGHGKGVAKQAGVATGGPLFILCTKRGFGTWWRGNLSGTVSVTWRSVPGGCRRGARLVLTVVPVRPGRCWLFLFGAKERRVKGKRDGRGSLTAGRNGPGRREKTGRPGFPRDGRKQARKKRRKRDGRGSLAMEGNGPGGKRGEHQQKQFKSRNASVATNNASNEGESEFSNEHSFSAYLSGNVKSTVWCLDSGVSEHLVKNDNHISIIQKLEHPVCIKIAKSGVTLKAETFGEIRGKSVVGNTVYNIYISKVLIVAGLEINLLSARKLEMQGLAVVFEQNCGRILKRDKIIGGAQCRKKLYEV